MVSTVPMSQYPPNTSSKTATRLSWGLSPGPLIGITNDTQCRGCTMNSFLVSPGGLAIFSLLVPLSSYEVRILAHIHLDPTPTPPHIPSTHITISTSLSPSLPH